MDRIGNKMKKFLKKGYMSVKNVFPADMIKLADDYYNIKFNIRNDFEQLPKDIVKPFNECDYADPLAESFLLQLLPTYRELTGLNLQPTYSFCRRYLKGQWLEKHIDRPSCQYSCTITVRSTLKKPWPIYMNGEKFSCEINEGIFYMGEEYEHYRKPLKHEGELVQLHLHYIDADNPKYLGYLYDNRKCVGYK